MSFQSLVNRVSFNSKGFDIVHNFSDGPILIVKNNQTANKKIVDLIKKLSDQDVEVINFSSHDAKNLSIEKFIKKIKIINIKLFFIIGGGSIIDYSKRIKNYIEETKKIKLKFYIIPSRIGSGAESSQTSILNYNNIKDIKVDSNYIPDGIIYYTELYESLSNFELSIGALDALMHCIESKLSLNKNDYLDYFSSSTIEFIKKTGTIEKLIGEKELNKNDFKNLSILSFNGGISQNNAGSGICHALAHATEELTSINHAQCISYFSIPVIKYLYSTSKSFKNLFNTETIELINKMSVNIKIRSNTVLINNIVKNNSELNSLINKAKKDPCWRLFKETINIDILKKKLINESITR